MSISHYSNSPKPGAETSCFDPLLLDPVIFRRLADRSAQSIGMVRLNKSMFYANDSLRQLLGIPMDASLVDYSFYDFYGPEDAIFLREEIIPKVRVCGEWVGEVGLRALNGKCYQTIQNIFLIRDDAGEPVAFANAITDISERKRLEAQEFKRIRKLRHLTQLSMTLSGAPIDIFQHVVSMVGELFEVRVVCFSHVVDDALYFKAVYVDGEVMLDAGNCSISITPCATVEQLKDIRIYEAVAELFPEAAFLRDHNAYSYCGFPSIDSNGKVVAVTCLLDDKPHEFLAEDQEILLLMGQRLAAELERERHIFERQQVEDELTHYREHLEQLVSERTVELMKQSKRNAAIVNAAIDGFFMADMQGCLRDCNEVYCEMLGYTQEEMVTLHITDIVDATDSAGPMSLRIQTALECGHDRFDTRHRRKDGSWVDVEVNVTVAQIGSEAFFFAFVHDITVRKQNEVSLINAKEEAERANNAKSRFLSRMSHELRTPMNAIIGFGQLLESDTAYPLAPDQLDSVKEILNAGNHLLELINEVLDLARIESGRLDFTLEPVKVSPLVKESVTLLQPLINSRQITVKLDLDGDCSIWVDRLRMRQILLNLLSNAIKYNRHAGSIRIGCLHYKERVRITMSDTGKGIPADKLSVLFKPFERLESAYDSVEGSGIGLALSKKLTEAMNGTIGVESFPDQGSLFWVDFPRVNDGESVAASGSAADVVLAESAKVSSTVLYMEDNPANLRLVQKIIGKYSGLVLLDAHLGKLGLEIAKTRHLDLILLDINLPDMDGFEILRELQANPATRDVPVLAISANAMARDIKRGLEAGFAGYLTKPLDIPKFLAVIDSQLNNAP